MPKISLLPTKGILKDGENLISQVDTKTIGLVLQQAKLGLHFEKEMNLNTRASENNQIRIFVKMSDGEKQEFRNLVKRSALAKYLPN